MYRAALWILSVLTLSPIAGPAFAQLDIDRLIDEAGLEAGPVAMRDHPGWRAPKKILVRTGSWVDVDLDTMPSGVQAVEVSSVEDVRANADGADAIIGFCSNDVVAAAPDVRWIQIFSAGAENCVAVDRVASGDVVLTNMQKMSSPVIGEHAIAMTLSLARGLTQYAKAMPTGEWNRSPDNFEITSLGGQTMLVAGLGGIGTETARRAAALGMRVLATRNSSRSGPDFVEYVGLSDELTELASRADVVVNALPLTPATTGLFDKAFFDAAKHGMIFVNVARGGSVVTADLVAALEDGRVSAAGLDVTDPEPLPPEHPLWQFDNVIITPHIAGAASERERHAVLLEENLRRYARGDALLNVVDPERGY